MTDESPNAETTQTFVLVGCGAAKRDEESEARNLYTSTYFQKKREFAEAVGDEWAILSAEHGLVDPSERIAPYDTTIDDLDDDALDQLAGEVSMGLIHWTTEPLARDVEVDRLVVLAGRSYLDPLRQRDTFSVLSPRVDYPLQRGDLSGIGDQMAWLKDRVDAHTATQTTLMTDGGREQDDAAVWQIGHFFADVGVESEPLSGYGEVWRYGVDPEDNKHTDHVVEVDLRDEPPVPTGGLDLGLFHPPCYEWTQREDESAENLIPRAREIAEKHCDEWIIENQPGAPLSAPEGGSLVTLHGSQFGLPVVYERQFETSYEVPEPARNQHWSAEHRVECTRPTRYWKAVKGVTGDYPRQTLVTNACPAAYVHWLVRPLLQGYQHRKDVQASLTEVSR